MTEWKEIAHANGTVTFYATLPAGPKGDQDLFFRLATLDKDPPYRDERYVTLTIGSEPYGAAGFEFRLPLAEIDSLIIGLSRLAQIIKEKEEKP